MNRYLSGLHVREDVFCRLFVCPKLPSIGVSEGVFKKITSLPQVASDMAVYLDLDVERCQGVCLRCLFQNIGTKIALMYAYSLKRPYGLDTNLGPT